MSLINERILMEELRKLEEAGAPMHGTAPEPVLPPTSAMRAPLYEPMASDEVDRLRAVVKAHGLELVNDGAVYRIKRQRDFMVWTLMASPLTAEERGGSEPNALIEAIKRFCGE